jgi:hypothetical protein
MTNIFNEEIAGSDLFIQPSCLLINSWVRRQVARRSFQKRHCTKPSLVILYSTPLNTDARTLPAFGPWNPSINAGIAVRIQNRLARTVGRTEFPYGRRKMSVSALQNAHGSIRHRSKETLKPIVKSFESSGICIVDWVAFGPDFSAIFRLRGCLRSNAFEIHACSTNDRWIYGTVAVACVVLSE